MSKKRIISKKSLILGAIIISCFIGIIGSLKIYKNLDISKSNNQNNIDEEKETELEVKNESENILEEKDNESEIIEIDGKEEKTPEVNNNPTQSNSQNTSNNQNKTQSQTNSNSSNTNKEQSKPQVDNNSQIEQKKLTKKEIEEYVRKTISDFRYDFDSVKECEMEGNKWMEYGWIYNCTTANVPNIDVVPTMLTITTGKLFCDGAFTKNEEYDYRKPKISNLKYLRSIGYPCTNIEDN